MSSHKPELQSAARQLDNLAMQAEFELYNVAAEFTFLAILTVRPHWIETARAEVHPSLLNFPTNRKAYQLMLDHAADCRQHGWQVGLDHATLVQAAYRHGVADAVDRELAGHLQSLALPQDLQPEQTWLSTLGSLRTAANKVAVYRQARQTQNAILQGHDPAGLASHAALQMSHTAASMDTGNAIRTLGDGPLTSASGAGIRPSILPWTMQQIGGLCPGTLSLLVARTGIGKSSLLMAIAIDLALYQNVPVLLLDDEMSEEQLRRRAVSNLSGVNDDIIRDGLYLSDPAAVDRVRAASQHLNNPNLKIAAMAGKPHDERLALMETFKRQHVDAHPSRRGLILFDYLKLPSDSGRANEWTLLGSMANDLKETAKRLELPVLSAVQASRNALDAEQADVIERGLGLVAGSDRISHVCDAVLYLRDLSKGEAERVKEKFGLIQYTGQTSPKNLLRFSQVLHILKNRNGDCVPEGTPLHFLRGQNRYREMAYTQDGSPSEEFKYVHSVEFMRKSPKPRALTFRSLPAGVGK